MPVIFASITRDAAAMMPLFITQGDAGMLRHFRLRYAFFAAYAMLPCMPLMP